MSETELSHRLALSCVVSLLNKEGASRGYHDQQDWEG